MTGFKLVPVKYLASYNDSVLAESTSEDRQIEYIEISDVDSVQGITGSTTYTFGDAPSRARRCIQSDDVLISTVRTYLKAIATVDHEHDGSIASTGFCVLRPSKIHPRFLSFAVLAPAFVDEVIAKSVGISYPAINSSDLVRIPVPVPSQLQQESIAAFLDRETNQIDDLIGKQERLIELLAEKRQAVITQAVTKGLDPDTPIRSSEIPWIDALPDHWTIEKCSSRFRAQKGREAASLTKEYCAEIPGTFPVYSGQTSNGGVMASIDRFEFDSGDEGVLFATTVGARAMSVSQIFGKFNLSQNCMIISSCAPVNMRYFFYQFQVLFHYERGLIPEHMQASFRMEDLYAYRLCIPPITEQREISDFLDTNIRRIDKLTEKVRSAISLMKERRSTLISAAVTGKIDVREGVA